MWHRINFFQLFIVSFLGQAIKILQKFFLKIFSKKASQQLSSNFSLDIWIDIGDFLNLEERQKLKLINHQICMAIENGMKKLWRTEEEAISAGDLLITAERVFLYRTNLVKMLGRQNLFLRTIVRAVENVNAGKLGIGDAIIVGCEYKPLLEGEKMENSDGLARIVNNLWTTVGKWIHRNDPKKENFCNYHNVLRQYEERLLVTPGQLMWGRTHKIYIKGYTIVFKCHLENDLDQHWITSTKIPKELCLKSNSDRKVECCNASESDAVFKFEDCFSLEILRPLEHCWPQQTNQQSFPNEMGPVHRGWLKEFDNFPSINLNKVDMEYYDHAFFLRPQCHMDIAENNYILHMHFPIFDLSKKPHIFANEQGLHFCDEQKLDFPFGDPTRELRKVFHRLIKLPENYKKNSLEWKQKEYPNERYFIIKI